MAEQDTEVIDDAAGAARDRIIRSRKQLADAQTGRKRAIKSSRVQAADDAERTSKGNMLPTPERKNHGSVIETTAVATETESARAGARVRRTQSPIERYAKRSLLTKRQVDAAEDLRSDWEFGIAGAHDSSMSGNGGGPAGLADGQLAAATAYRQATQAIGKRLSSIVLPIVIGYGDGAEITAGMLAKQREDPNEQRVMGILSVGLDTLADHYASSTTNDVPQNIVDSQRLIMHQSERSPK